VLSLEVPVDELEKGMEILNDVLKNPSFPKADLKRHIMEQTAFLSEEAPNSSRVLAAAASSYAWYPADSVYGARPDLDGLRKLKTSALQNGYQQLLSSSPISILIVGNVQYADIEPKLLTLVEGLGAAEEHSQAAAFTPPSTQRVIAVDLPGNPQTRIGLRMRGPTFNDPDRLSAQVLNYALGGHFLSRLNTNLREEKGFTYGSRSSYFSDKELGSWVIGVDVATENAAATATEIKYELKRLVDEGVSEAELQMAYTSYTADWNNTMETASNASYAYAARLINQIPITDAREDISKLQGITIEMTKETAAKYLTDDQPSVWVFIGDRKNLEAQLEQFGDKVEWLDRKQVILGNF
jgi:zinc protease